MFAEAICGMTRTRNCCAYARDKQSRGIHNSKHEARPNIL